MQAVKAVQVTIVSGAALSGIADLNFEQLVGVVMPAGWDAAALSFQHAIDGSTFGDVFTASGEFTVPSADVAAARTLLLDTHATPGLRFVKVRSGLTAAPVNQTADRVITLLTRDMAD